MNRIQPIKVFGSQAEEIREGEIFSSSVGSVEGRKVVTLNHLGHLEGKTVLHIGKNNTFNHIAPVISKPASVIFLSNNNTDNSKSLALIFFCTNC